jgi:hypothetical protein
MNKIDVFTFLTSNSADYAELLHRSCEMLKSKRTKLAYYCVESIGSERIPDGWQSVAKSSVDLGHNCLNHAHAMHLALKELDAANVIFIDADMCMLQESWDQHILNELIRRPIYGTAFGDNGMQYNRFPNVFMFCFKRRILNMLDLDFNPDLDDCGSPRRKRIDTLQYSDLFNKRLGQTLKCDTGWRLPIIAHRSGIPYDYMPRVLGCDKNSQLPYANDEQKRFCLKKKEHMAEWHYRDRLFVTHLQASRNHGIDSEWSKAWKERIDLFTQEKYGWRL